MTSVWNRDILEGHCPEQSGWWAELPGYRKPLWGGGEGLWRKRQESFPGDKPLLWGARHMPASPYVLLHFLWPLPSLLSRLTTFPVGQDSLPWFSKSVPRLPGGAQWKPAETSCLLAEDRAEQGRRTEKQQKRPRCKMTLWGFYWFFWGEGWYFWPHYVACGILVPEPGIEPVPPTVKVWIVDHWATRQVPWLLVKSARLRQSHACEMLLKPWVSQELPGATTPLSLTLAVAHTYSLSPSLIPAASPLPSVPGFSPVMEQASWPLWSFRSHSMSGPLVGTRPVSLQSCWCWAESGMSWRHSHLVHFQGPEPLWIYKGLCSWSWVENAVFGVGLRDRVEVEGK